jgi:tetratricopeptide (TPR) repeat protein
MVRRLRSIVVVAASAVLFAGQAYAQNSTARAVGVVRDEAGKPIKGATIRAFNPEFSPRSFISTSDSKGRWGMVGLRVGTYTFVVDAPGFVPMRGDGLVRTGSTAPINFVLPREPGLTPGALPSNIQAQITAANMMRDQGRLDQAISVYQDIRTRYANLTSLNLVIGATYRRKAALEADASTRRAALDRAIECYTDLLKANPDDERAKAELAATQAEASAIPN